MKDYWTETQNETKPKKINKKKIIILTIVILISILIIAGITIYKNNKEARDWIDKNIFRKEVMQDKVATIELKEENNYEEI